jgi:acyl-CoA reductase-like NAD-dependent aldehyde dehydrogenase
MSTTVEPSIWETRAAELNLDGRAVIANRSIDARSGETFEKRSPVDGRVLATVAAGDAPDIDDAVQAARKAFEDGMWAQLAPRKRKTLLLEYAQGILDQKQDLALLSTLEMGKPIGDSLSEVDLTAQCISARSRSRQAYRRAS